MSKQIDWDATGSMLSGIGTIGGVIAVVIASIIARNTYNQFKRQKLTERLIEHAERILVATYKAQYAIDFVRGRILWAAELEKAEKQLRDGGIIQGEKGDRDKRMVSASVYMDRLNVTNADQKQLIEILPIARALWGIKLEKSINDLYRQFWLVQTYASESVETDDRQRRSELSQLLNGQCESSEDEISQNVRRLTQEIEAECLPILKAADPDMKLAQAVVDAARIALTGYGIRIGPITLKYGGRDGGIS